MKVNKYERDRYLANNNEFRCDGCDDVFNNDEGKTITDSGDELCTRCAQKQGGEGC